MVPHAAAAAKSLQSCPTLCDPIDTAHQALPSLGFSRQEHWSGLPFPAPMHESESEVAESCPTLSDPTDCSLPGSSVHGIFQARVLEWGVIAFSWVPHELTANQKYCHFEGHLLLFYTTANHFSIGLRRVTKSRFYTIASDAQLSGWTKKKLQSSFQSQTCTEKKDHGH